MTATVTSFDGTDASAAAAALVTLAPETDDAIVFWQFGNTVFVAKIATF